MRIELARRLATTERAAFLVDALDLPTATDMPDAEWEPFQLDHLNDDGTFRIDAKSRQVGWSWLIASEAAAITQLEARATYMFVSINREESAEKIRYARSCYEALYPGFRKKLVADNVNALIFEDGSRILSMPQRPVRGKAKAWVGLDEFAHYRLDREIYTAALPVTTKGGRIRIGSSPLGARGMFWEIAEQRVRPYPGYSRNRAYWWTVGAVLKPEWKHKLREVSQRAPLMSTEERVLTFANQRILDIFLNIPLEDFQQEYECAYVDETVAYIAWADILAAVMPDDARHMCRITRTADDALAAIDALADDVAEKRLVGDLTWGLDVGRKRDLTELIVIERQRNGARTMRAMFSLDRQSFAVQEALCRRLLERVPTIRRGYMDQNGLGMQLAETLYQRDGYGERAMPMPFTNASKALMAQHTKTRFQKRGDGQLHIPDHRDLKYQIHSVRRTITANANVVFDVEHSERHHADKWWALALAVEACETLERIEHYPASGSQLVRMVRSIGDATEGGEREFAELAGMEGAYALDMDELDALIEEGIVYPAWMPRHALPPNARVVEADPPRGREADLLDGVPSALDMYAAQRAATAPLSPPLPPSLAPHDPPVNGDARAFGASPLVAEDTFDDLPPDVAVALALDRDDD